MLHILILGAVLLVAAIVINIMLIVRGFRQGIKEGILSLLAPLLLGSGMVLLFLVSQEAALASVGAEEALIQGEKEFDAQIEALDEMENIDIGL